MDPENAKNAAARKVVAERLRRFFAALTTQLATGTAEIWSRVERRLVHEPPGPESDGEPAPSSDLRRRPVQQQQMKAQDEK